MAADGGNHWRTGETARDHGHITEKIDGHWNTGYTLRITVFVDCDMIVQVSQDVVQLVRRYHKQWSDIRKIISSRLTEIKTQLDKTALKPRNENGVKGKFTMKALNDSNALLYYRFTSWLV